MADHRARRSTRTLTQVGDKSANCTAEDCGRIERSTLLLLSTGRPHTIGRILRAVRLKTLRSHSNAFAAQDVLESGQMEPYGRIFISHATSDKPLAEALIDLFVTGLGLATEQIFCSSIEGHTIPAGAEFKYFMLNELTAGAAVVALISPSYMENTWCVCELGATWGLAKDLYPVLIPPVTYKSLPPFLAGTQSLLIENESHLDRMSDGLPKLFGKTCNIAKWNTKKDQFLKRIPELLKDITKPARPTQQEVAILQTALQDYKALVGELTQDKEQLSAKLAAISKLKDKKETVKVLQSFTGEPERFKQLAASTRSAILQCSWATREALFQWYRGSLFRPGLEWPRDDVQAAVESGELIENRSEEAVFEVNEEKPKIKKALAALRELREFSQRASPEFAESFEQQYDDNFDVESRDFWSRFFKRA